MDIEAGVSGTDLGKNWVENWVKVVKMGWGGVRQYTFTPLPTRLYPNINPNINPDIKNNHISQRYFYKLKKI